MKTFHLSEKRMHRYLRLLLLYQHQLGKMLLAEWQNENAQNVSTTCDAIVINCIRGSHLFHSLTATHGIAQQGRQECTLERIAKILINGETPEGCCCCSY